MAAAGGLTATATATPTLKHQLCVDWSRKLMAPFVARHARSSSFSYGTADGLRDQAVTMHI